MPLNNVMDIDAFIANYQHGGLDALNEGSGSWSLPRSKIPPSLTSEIDRWDSFDVSTEEKYRKLRDKNENANNHTLCAFLDCKKRGDSKGAVACCLIEALYDVIGQMPYELQRLRDRIAEGKLE